MLEQAKIRPVIYRTYKGLECVPRALEDLAARKVWGKSGYRSRNSEAAVI
jgi:hypothetical protein